MVGSVRTGMSRLRHAVTTFWRSVPGADGIAMITSSGLVSSSTRGEVVGACRGRGGRRRRIPCLRGSSSTKPITARRQLGVAAQLQRDLLAAVAGADDQHLARAALDERPRSGRSTTRAHDEARAARPAPA